MMRSLLHIALIACLMLSGISAAFARGAAPASDQMVICAAQGSYVVYLDADGAPTGAPHPCPDCLPQLAAPLPALAPLALPRQVRLMQKAASVARPETGAGPEMATARGPPVLSV